LFGRGEARKTPCGSLTHALRYTINPVVEKFPG